MGDDLPVTSGLVVKGLVAGYKGRPISRVPYLTVAGGDAAVLGGRSGAGKTTLLLAIAGLADRLEGAVCLDGQDIGRLPPAVATVTAVRISA